MATIPRKLPKTLDDWQRNKPTMWQANEHLKRVIRSAPPSWQAAIAQRFNTGAPLLDQAMTVEEWCKAPPEWVVAWDLMQLIADFEDRFGRAALWNLDDDEICAMAKKLAAEADELDALAQSQGLALEERVDSIRLLVRASGIKEEKPLEGLPAILRAQDPAWWRRRLRVHVARTVEAGAIDLGLVHVGAGGYVSDGGLSRRKAQIKRNAEALERMLLRNEAGQVYTVAELAALGVANPVIRGGELMTRIRGAEEYADSRAHVGMFITLTAPSRFHRKRHGSGGRIINNPKWAGANPRDTQAWLNDMWQKSRAKLHRKGVRFYGLRVAEPHHDGTPHWHMLVWVENEVHARMVEQVLRHYWLSDDGNERGAQENRLNFKRMTRGGAAGYVAKYIAKSVGHIALAEHKDVVDGQQLSMEFGKEAPEDWKESSHEGYQRVDAWASQWGIRQFQALGMPSVTVWRELRRVSPDQLELFEREGDRQTVRAFHACHRIGDLRADWRQFMEAMGGHALKRCDWHLRIVRREVQVMEKQVNKYQEELRAGPIVGLEAARGCMRGTWLVSRRIAWRAVVGEELSTELQQDSGAAQEKRAHAALPRAWTGFNNCTARLTGGLHRRTFGRGLHNIEDCYPPEVVAKFQKAQLKAQLKRAWQ